MSHMVNAEDIEHLASDAARALNIAIHAEQRNVDVACPNVGGFSH